MAASMPPPMNFSADDTCDVGCEGGALVGEDCGPRDNAFTGEVDWVQIDLGKDAEDDDLIYGGAGIYRDGATVARFDLRQGRMSCTFRPR